MTTFPPLIIDTNIHDLIQETFDADLPISGAWGYTQKEASIIESLPSSMTRPQLQHMITSMRCHLEMNITQVKAHRYGGINANEKAREIIKNDTSIFDKVTYEVSAIKEDLYHAFVKEYKMGYETEMFDISNHFKRRKEATLTRVVTHYFEVSNLVF